MDTVKIVHDAPLGIQFIPARFLPEGKDEYYLRDAREDLPRTPWRQLHAGELEQLVKNGNSADDWDDIRVSDPFDPGQILNNTFHGLVRIGTVEDVSLEHHDLRLPVGITNSKIVSCDIGDYVAIHNVHYLAHYIIGDRCILTNIDEMHTSNYAKFGNGIIKDGESPDVRITLDLVNETGSRAVSPFDGMITADAYLWARYREDTELQKRLLQMTQDRYDSRRGYYGTAGEQSVIKNSRIIKDVKIGTHCYIKGANKLKNLTVNSNAQEPTQIGEGVELVNGIIGFGCRVFYGCKAVRFILGNNCNLKYGARLIHSFMGDNSTVSCCELLNNLIFPAHEQHHNNSFLVAGLVMGQSNIAAGATIGSNHNSRANDNEIQAGRGFWPGLCTSLKHSSRFASFVLLAKGAYPAELNIPLPFALLDNNTAGNRLDVLPAFWWMHNMYALSRNAWKFAARDNRKTRVQHIEFESLAPDTVNEIIHARYLLELWTGKAIAPDSTDPVAIGADALRGYGPAADELSRLIVRGEGMEKSPRETRILKPRQAYEAYGEMLHHYAAVNLLRYLEEDETRSVHSLHAELGAAGQSNGNGEWENLGGQLVPVPDVDAMRADIRSGKLDSWDAVHRRYDELWNAYPLQKQRHAYSVYQSINGSGSPDDRKTWESFLDRAISIQELVRDRVYESRKKDFENPFRIATYRNTEEMTAALGTIDENSFVLQVNEETEEFRRRITKIRARR